VLYGFPNHTQQELMLLYDPDVISARHDPQGPVTGKHGRAEAPRFDGTFRIDLDIDATEDVVTFSKPPLEAALDTPLGRDPPDRGAREIQGAPRRDDTGRGHEFRHRQPRKQLAQCIWLRRRIDAPRCGRPLIVAGDLNDGPGLDDYERLFGRSGVEIVMGGPARNSSTIPMPRRAVQSRIAAQPTTARFFIARDERWLAALLDYIMVSPPCAPRRGAGASGIRSTTLLVRHGAARRPSRRLGPFPRDAGSCRPD
jgi:hypothetical protein